MKRLSRRSIGKVMIAIGTMGVIVSLTSVIVGQSLIRQVETSVDDSLSLTREALSAVKDSIAVTDSIVTTIRTGVASVQTTLDAVGTSIDDTSGAIADSGEFLGGSLPDALIAINDVLPTIESIASSVDDALRVLEQAPFGPDYDPVQPFDEAIADLSVAIEPLPGELEALSVEFEGLATSSSAISVQVDLLGSDIAALDRQLASVAVLLGRYGDTAARAERLAVASRNDLDVSATSARWLLITLGVVFALGQVVPIWLGTVLIKDSTSHTIISRRGDSTDLDQPPTPGDRRT